MSAALLLCSLLAQAPAGVRVEEQRIDRARAIAEEPRLELRLELVEGEHLATVTAVNASFRSLVDRVSREINCEVVGLDVLERDPAFYAKLERQPLGEALAWIAGSVGLHAQLGPTRLAVKEELPVYPTRAELFGLANTAYFRATIDHPDSRQAPRAAWIRAEIAAETSSQPLDSARQFDWLVETYPESDLVPEALLAAGEQYARAASWEAARERFDELASHRIPHPFGVEARRRLADAHARIADLATNPDVRRSNSERALHVLDALDDSHPSNDFADRRERLMIRSLAYSIAGQPIEALKAIDLAARYGTLGDRDPELRELRARALDRAGRYELAYPAWMQHAESLEGEAKGLAYRRAAASANAYGSSLAAIAAWRTAERAGLGDYVAEEHNRAMIALGLEQDIGNIIGDRDRLAQGERQLDGRRYEEAADVLRPVFDRRFGLDRVDRLRLALVYARALDRTDRLEEAVHVLRTAAQESERSADRRELYLAASTMFERRGDLERAIDAMSGAL